MAKILVNYIYNKANDEFKLMDQGCVFADMKIAVMETEERINKVLVVPIQGQMTVVDREAYEVNNKRFYLVSDDKGNVFENQNGTEIWLPKDTDISKLRYIDGRLVLLEDEKKQEEEPKEQAKPKKPKKGE